MRVSQNEVFFVPCLDDFSWPEIVVKATLSRLTCRPQGVNTDTLVNLSNPTKVTFFVLFCDVFAPPPGGREKDHCSDPVFVLFFLAVPFSQFVHALAALKIVQLSRENHMAWSKSVEVTKRTHQNISHGEEQKVGRHFSYCRNYCPRFEFPR